MSTLKLKTSKNSPSQNSRKINHHYDTNTISPKNSKPEIANIRMKFTLDYMKDCYGGDREGLPSSNHSNLTFLKLTHTFVS